MQLVLIAVLLGLSTLVDANAIKGHSIQRPQEESRSIKLAPPANNLEKSAVKSAAQVQAAPAAPILESSKKVYNDESIRRLAASPVVAEQVPIVAVAAKQPEPVKPVEQQAAPVVQQAAQFVQQAPPAPEAPIKEEPKQKVESLIAPKNAPVEPAVVVPVVVAAAAPAVAAPVVSAPAKPEDLPPQSDRSAPIKEQSVPAVVHVEHVVPAKVVEQPQAPVAPEVAASPVAPAVAPVQPEVVAKESPLQAKKDEVVAPVVAAASQPAPVEPLNIEVPAPDPGLVLSEPIDSTTKLLIDLDEHVQKFLPAEDQQAPQAPKDQHPVAGVDYSPSSGVAASPANPTGKSSGPLVPYSGADEHIVPPLPSLEGVEKASAGSPAQAPASQSASGAAAPSATRQGGHQNQNQQQVITQLLDQLDSLQNRIQDTTNQLVARRRYVMSALLRPMGTYVRRVRTNLERLQNRVNQLQATASSVGNGQNRPGGFVDAAAIETIRRRIDDISKRISDIVNRIRISLTPTSAPLNSNGRK